MQTWEILLAYAEDAGFSPKKVCYLPGFSEAKAGSKLSVAALLEYHRAVVKPFIEQMRPKVIIALGNTAVCAAGLNDKPEKVGSFQRKRGSIYGFEATASLDPFFVLSSPDENHEDFAADFRFAKRLYDRDFKDQVDMVIEDLETPESVNQQLILPWRTNPRLDWDVESTGLNRDNDLVVTMGFYNRKRTALGEHIAYFWGGFDQMRPRFEENVLSQFAEVFIELFEQGNKTLSIGGFNCPFDAWITESNLGRKLPYPARDLQEAHWVIYKHGRNNLKDNSSRYFGYPNYDEPVDRWNRDIKASRGGVMWDTDPLFELNRRTLEDWHGFSMEELFSSENKQKGKGYKWPKNEDGKDLVDKGSCMFAMMPHDMIRLYQCFSGDTKFLTKERGVVSFTEVVGNKLTVLNNKAEWVEAECKHFGSQLTHNYEFIQGFGGNSMKTVRCTERHNWLLMDGSKVRTDQLKYGDVVPFIAVKRQVDTESEDYVEGLKHGIVYGDGTTLYTPGKTRKRGHRVRLSGTKVEMLWVFAGHPTYTKNVYRDGEPTIDLLGDKYVSNDLKALPDEQERSDAYMVGFFRGWLNTDGAVCVRSHTVISCGLGEAEWAKRVMPLYGYEFRAWSEINKDRQIGDKYDSPTGNGTLVTKNKRVGNLAVNRASLTIEDFLVSNKRARFVPMKTFFVFKGQVEGTAQVEDVYCNVVPEHHNFVLEDGMVTGNCYDAVYTGLGSDHMEAIIYGDPKLEMSLDVRHKLTYRLMRCQQRGMLLDVPMNRQWSKELGVLLDKAEVEIQKGAKQIRPDLENFNPNSHDQIRLLLYGDPVSVPHIDPDSLYEVYGRDYKSRTAVNEKVALIHDRIYHGYDEIESIVTENATAYDAKSAKEAFEKNVKTMLDDPKAKAAVEFKDVPMYFNGLYSPNPAHYTKKAKKPGTGRTALEHLYEENPQEMLRYMLMRNKAKTLKGTFVDGIYQRIDENNVFHPGYKTTRVVTGRISSHDPNGTNQPAKSRGLAIPREHFKFVHFDLSTAEIRVLAAMSQDKVLMDAMYAEDFHSTTAMLIWDLKSIADVTPLMRQAAKTISFGIIYGMSADKLARALGISVEEAEDIMVRYKSRFKQAAAWMENQVVLVGGDEGRGIDGCGYVETSFGTRIPINNIWSTDKEVRSKSIRACVNYPIQGTAGELTFWFGEQQMLAFEAQGLEYYFVNNTHDYMCYEVPEEFAWNEDTGRVDKKGKAILKPCGPFVDIIQSTIHDDGCNIPPLDTVKFKGDIEVTDRFYCKPNMMKAIDPNYGDEDKEMPWHLITGEARDEDEKAELEELEAA